MDPVVVPSVEGNRHAGRFITPASFVVLVSGLHRCVITQVILTVVGVRVVIGTRAATVRVVLAELLVSMDFFTDSQ